MTRNVLVRGTGSIGTRHLQVLRQMPDVQPLAWPVRAGRRAGLEADGLTVFEGTAAPRALPHSGAIVATDTGRHVTDSLDLLKAGWHVLVEKPLAADAAAGQPLVEAKVQAGRQVFVAAPLRFAAGLQAFREHLPQIGPVHAVRIECQSYLPDWRPDRDYRQSYAARAGEGGVLRDLIHEIDYAGWLFGWPAAVIARFQDGSRLGIESETGVDLLWDTAAGNSISLRLDYLSRTTRRQLRAHGTAGDMTWDAIGQTVTLQRPGSPDIVTSWPQSRDAILRAQTEGFLAAVDGQSSPILATVEDGLRALAVCDAARRAAASGNLTPVLAGGF